MPSILPSRLYIMDGDEEILSSSLRISQDYKITRTSRLRLSGLFYRTRPSSLRVEGTEPIITSSQMRVSADISETIGSSLRVGADTRHTLLSVLRLYDNPSGQLEGNIGARHLGVINLANREIETRDKLKYIGSSMRIAGQIEVVLSSCLNISHSEILLSGLHIYDIIEETLESRLCLSDQFYVPVGSSLYIWDIAPTVLWGTYPEVLLDGYSTIS